MPEELPFLKDIVKCLNFDCPYDNTKSMIADG